MHNLLFLISSAAHPGYYTAFSIHPATGSSNDTAGGCHHINISHLCKVRNLQDIESLALSKNEAISPELHAVDNAFA